VRVLVFGGSFNPVHVGHLMMAEEIREEFGYERVLFVPAARSPFKDGSGDPGQEHRLAMLELAVAGNPGFAIDARELGRGGKSFTIETIRSMVAEGLIDERPGMLVGDDLVSGLPLWRKFDLLRQETDIIVGRRSGTGEDGGRVGPESGEARYLRASNRIVPLSSSDIRGLIASRRSIRYLVPDAVRNYIVERHLYESR